MKEKTGTAKVTIEDQVIPGMDGTSCGISIPERSMDAAMEVMRANPGYLGFQFAKAYKAEVVTDDGETMTLTKTVREKNFYRYAEKIVSLEDFKASEELKPAFDFASKNAPHLLDGKSVIFVTGANHPLDKVKYLAEYEQQSTVLISKQGQQLWPTQKV